MPRFYEQQKAVTRFGSISRSGERDTYRITLSGGRRGTTFRFDATGFGLDPTLRVTGSGLNLFSDDGPGLNSRIFVRVALGFTARVRATVAGFGSDTGNYRLTVVP
jgi:hypothetical protein